MTPATPLTEKNYRAGYLIDDEWMGGVSENEENSNIYTAYIVSHSTGELVGSHLYPTLNEALQALNSIPRQWTFEPFGGAGCGGGTCRTLKDGEEDIPLPCGGGECAACGACGT